MKDAPRILIPVPPLLYVIPLLLGAGADRLIPLPLFPGRLQYLAGAALASAAALIMPFVLAGFRRARTNFDARKPATRIIATGPYRYSRNPAYVALALVYLGIAVAVDSAWLLAGFLPAFLLMHYGVILPEEQYLEEKFGAEYVAYKSAVRRYL